MLELGIGGYTRQQVIDVLHGRSGSRGIVKFRCDLLNREEIKIGELAVQSGRVSMNSLAEIKRTALFELTEQEAQDVDWLNDRIRPVFCLKMPEIRKTYKAWGKIDASFSRSSIAYLSDGTQVAANASRFEPGKFGKAVMVEEGTENLLKEPLFNGVLDTTYWNTRNAAYTLSIDTNTKYMGYNSLKIVANKIGGAGSDIIMKSTQMPTIDTDYVFSFYAKASEPVKLTVRWGLGATQNSVDITTEWQKYSVIARTGSQAYQNLLPYFDKIATLWIALPQLEAKPYPTSFTDGTRAAETLTIPTEGVLNPQEGTVEFVVIPNYASSVVPASGYGFTDLGFFITPAYYSGFSLRRKQNSIELVIGTGSTYNYYSYSTTWNAKDQLALAVKWDTMNTFVLLNGQRIITAPKFDTTNLPSTLMIGNRHVYTNQAGNALYDDLRISNRARTDAEILAAYQSGQPAPVDEWTTAKFDFDNGLTGEYFTIVNDSKPVQWIEWPLGIFMPSSPTRKSDGGRIVREVEAYDTSLVLKEDVFTDRYFIPAGTKYVDAIMDILNGADIWKVNILDHPGTLARDKEFEIGTPKLTVVNELLAAINYTSIWVDEHGYFTSRPYVLPSDREAEYEYRTDDISIILPGGTEELDLFSVPNKWVRYVSNPDTGTVLRSEYANDLSTSPTSTVRRGRTIVNIEPVDDIADQETLDAYVRRIAYQASQVYGHFEFSTAVMPHHSFYDCLYIEHKGLGISSKYMESSWELPLQADGTMTHSCRKVIRI